MFDKIDSATWFGFALFDFSSEGIAKSCGMLSKYFYDYFPIGLCLICRKKSSIVLRYNVIFCAIFRRHFCKTPIWSFSNYIIQQKIFFYMIFKIIMKIYLTYTFKLKTNYIRKQKYRYNDDNWLLVIKWPKKYR